MRTLALNNLAHVRPERFVALVLALTLVCSIAVYGYSIVSSVVNVMLRQELMVDIQNTQDKISELESEYLHRSQSLTEASLADAGLVPLPSATFVQVDPGTERLSRLP